MMNVLICGANSQILRSFIQRYQPISRIAGISRSSNTLLASVCCYDLSINSEHSIINSFITQVFRGEPYTLIISAWSGTPRTSSNHTESYDHFTNNLTIQSQIATIIRTSPPKHIIFISTAGAMYPISQYPWTETYISPTSVYGAQKYAAEKFYSNISSKSNIPICILRISTAYSLSNKSSRQGVVNAWLHGAANKSIELYANLLSEVNFISTFQIATALKYVADHQLVGTFNLASDKNISLQRVLEAVCSPSRLQEEVNLRYLGNQMSSLYIDTSKFTKETQLVFPAIVLQDINYFKYTLNNQFAC